MRSPGSRTPKNDFLIVLSDPSHDGSCEPHLTQKPSLAMSALAWMDAVLDVANHIRVCVAASMLITGALLGGILVGNGTIEWWTGVGWGTAIVVAALGECINDYDVHERSSVHGINDLFLYAMLLGYGFLLLAEICAAAKAFDIPAGNTPGDVALAFLAPSCCSLAAVTIHFWRQSRKSCGRAVWGVMCRRAVWGMLLAVVLAPIGVPLSLLLLLCLSVCVHPIVERVLARRDQDAPATFDYPPPVPPVCAQQMDQEERKPPKNARKTGGAGGVIAQM